MAEDDDEDLDDEDSGGDDDGGDGGDDGESDGGDEGGVEAGGEDQSAGTPAAAGGKQEKQAQQGPSQELTDAVSDPNGGVMMQGGMAGMADAGGQEEPENDGEENEDGEAKPKKDFDYGAELEHEAFGTGGLAGGGGKLLNDDDDHDDDDAHDDDDDDDHDDEDYTDATNTKEDYLTPFDKDKEKEEGDEQELETEPEGDEAEAPHGNAWEQRGKGKPKDNAGKKSTGGVKTLADIIRLVQKVKQSKNSKAKNLLKKVDKKVLAATVAYVGWNIGVIKNGVWSETSYWSDTIMSLLETAQGIELESVVTMALKAPGVGDLLGLIEKALLKS